MIKCSFSSHHPIPPRSPLIVLQKVFRGHLARRKQGPERLKELAEADISFRAAFEALLKLQDEWREVTDAAVAIPKVTKTGGLRTMAEVLRLLCRNARDKVNDMVRNHD